MPIMALAFAFSLLRSSAHTVWKSTAPVFRHPLSPFALTLVLVTIGEGYLASTGEPSPAAVVSSALGLHQCTSIEVRERALVRKMNGQMYGECTEGAR